MKSVKFALHQGDVPHLVYQHLKEQILSGELAAGEVVKIDQIREEIGTSIVPVREAIRMLTGEGLMEMRPRRSPIVAPLDFAEFVDVATIRMAMEPFLVKLATPNHTKESLQVCKRLIQDDENSSDFNEKVALNKEFHIQLLKPSDRPGVIKLLDDQYEKARRFNQMFVHRRTDPSGSAATKAHREILEAVEAGDENRAAHSIYNHILLAFQRIEVSLKK